MKYYFLIFILLISSSICNAQIRDTLFHKVLLIKIEEFNEKYPEYNRELILCVDTKNLGINLNSSGADFESRTANNIITILPKNALGFELYYCRKFGSISMGMQQANKKIIKSKKYDKIYYDINSILPKYKLSKNDGSGLLYFYGFKYANIKACYCGDLVPPTKDKIVPIELELVRYSKSSKREKLFIKNLIR